MSIDTNLHGRLRNTSLPASSALMPLYEAVSNSIHAIEDAKIQDDGGEITVEIVRDAQTSLDFDGKDKRRGPEAQSDIIGFRITDNGIGFNDGNMQSFLTLDSEYKATRGGRGVGRLLWLKAFDRAEIDSTFIESDGTSLRRRRFKFDAQQGVSDSEIVDPEETAPTTTIYLAGFVKKYREASPKTARTIAKNLFEHCLWYFVRTGGAPKIYVLDNGENVLLEEVYDEHMVAGAVPEEMTLKGTKFELLHVKLSASSTRNHSIAFCAANRLVITENIKGKIPGLFGALHDDAGNFIYECYVSSLLLDECVRSERTGFDIEEEPLELFEDSELSLKDIRAAVLGRTEVFLSSYLEEKRQLGRDRVAKFVANTAPRYRPILKRIPASELAVDPSITDKDLDLLLHRQLSEIEGQLMADGHDVMTPRVGESKNEYEERLHEYLSTAEDIKKSDLVNYVAHRRIILDLLELALRRKDDGSYEREDIIHNLIMPMGTTSEDGRFDTCNLWLVDERLAFHDFLASDKTLAAIPITDSTETKEPDLISFNVFDTPVLVSETQTPPLASITVVELKRPMRNDAGAGEAKDPIEQAIGYLERIRSGKVKTQSGRPIPKSEDIPGFCYAICDITPSVEKRCKILGLTPTHDFSGYFGYNPNFRAYLEVISYDRLVIAAKERNRAFFDKLGLPAK